MAPGGRCFHFIISQHISIYVEQNIPLYHRYLPSLSTSASTFNVQRPLPLDSTTRLSSANTVTQHLLPPSHPFLLSHLDAVISASPPPPIIQSQTEPIHPISPDPTASLYVCALEKCPIQRTVPPFADNPNNADKIISTGQSKREGRTHAMRHQVAVYTTLLSTYPFQPDFQQPQTSTTSAPSPHRPTPTLHPTSFGHPSSSSTNNIRQYRSAYSESET